MLVNSIRLQFFLVYELNAQERTTAVAEVSRALTSGRLHNRVGPTFPLADVVAAHEAVESGKTVGNVLVRIA